MALQGDVSTLPVRELLGLLARTRASGRLSVSRGMEARRFHLRDGQVTLASSSEPEQLLGKLLVDRGLLDQGQLANALQGRARQGHGQGHAAGSARLGTTLSQTGLVPAPAVAQVLADKIENLLVDVLAWTDGQFYFDAGAANGNAADAALHSDVTTTVDLAVVLKRQAAVAKTARKTAQKTWVVTDADVIETTPLAPDHGVPRRRKRAASV